MSQDVLGVILVGFVLFFRDAQSKIDPFTYIGSDLWSLRGPHKAHGAGQVSMIVRLEVPGRGRGFPCSP